MNKVAKPDDKVLNPPGLAIFDLDYTLTKRGTWGRFVMQCVKERPHIWLPLLLAAGSAQLRYKLGLIPRVAVKRAMMAWAMPNWPRDKIIAKAEAFARKEVENGLRPGAILALEKHKAQEDSIMLASAAVSVVVEPIAKLLGIEHFVATEMRWDNDCLSRDFASENCYGTEKLRRVQEYLRANPSLKQTNTIITMYSDSCSDLAIMQFADVGISVNPDRRLLAISKDNNFAVVDWMKA